MLRKIIQLTLLKLKQVYYTLKKWLKKIFDFHAPGILILEIPKNPCEVCELELVAGIKLLLLSGWRIIDIEVLNEKEDCCKYHAPEMRQILLKLHLIPSLYALKSRIIKSDASPLNL